MSTTVQHTQKGIALYIHWPFCLSKCPYCDFNSHVAHSIPQEEYAMALLKELKHAIAQISTSLLKPSLTSIFFGGGTPSLMAPHTVQSLIDYATSALPPAPSIEITLEANPTSVEIEKLKDFHTAGVNRISLGIQSLNPMALKALGREHSVPQAINALSIAKSTFERVSFDLIYAREGQTISEWKQELTEALSLANDHLSLYQLTIEPGTIFAKQYAKGKIQLPDQEIGADFLSITEEITQQYGLYNYEISNYAKPGSESRHNLTYWQYQDYIGIGPGAHGRVTIQDKLYATERHKNPQKWLHHVDQHGHAISEIEALSPIDKAREMVLMGLRLTKGINAEAFQERCSMPLTDVIDLSMLNILMDEDYISWNHHILKTTPKGKLRLNAILEAILL